MGGFGSIWGRFWVALVSLGSLLGTSWFLGPPRCLANSLGVTISGSFQKLPNASECIRTRPKASENLRKRSESSTEYRFSPENSQKFSETSERIRTHQNASECIRTHPNGSERIRTRPRTSENAKKLPKTCEKSRKRRNFVAIFSETPLVWSHSIPSPPSERPPGVLRSPDAAKHVSTFL